jgi:hypothetical protein
MENKVEIKEAEESGEMKTRATASGQWKGRSALAFGKKQKDLRRADAQLAASLEIWNLNWRG